MADFIEYYAPTHWAAAIVNADPSGLEDEEETAIVEWLEHCASQGLELVDACVDDVDFIKYHDAYAFFPYASDCCVYRFTR